MNHGVELVGPVDGLAWPVVGMGDMPVGDCHMSPFFGIFLRGFPGHHGIMRPARFPVPYAGAETPNYALRLQFTQKIKDFGFLHARGPGKIEKGRGRIRQILLHNAQKRQLSGAEFRFHHQRENERAKRS